jgi:Icc protein
VIVPRKNVKAYFYGHRHEYKHRQVDGLHIVALPSTAWIFIKGEPLAWTDLQVEENGAKLRLYCLDPQHPKHKNQLDLKWRA